MNLHTEVPAFASHEITRYAPAMLYYSTAPFSDFDKKAIGAARARELSRRPIDRRWLHLGWAENLITDPKLEEKWQPGDMGRMIGPSATDAAIGIVQNKLFSGYMCAMIEPLARACRDNMVKEFRGFFLDAEFMVNRQQDNRRFFPGLWDLLTRSTPGVDDTERERLTRVAVFTAARRALAHEYFDPDLLACYLCADRPTGWGANPVNLPALGVPTPRPHLLFTTPHPEATARMERELTGGSGPERAVVHLASGTPPTENRKRLEICRHLNVADVILFPELELPGNRPATDAERMQLGNALLTAQLPVFRDFAAAA